MSSTPETGSPDPKLSFEEGDEVLYRMLVYGVIAAYAVLLLIAVLTWQVTIVPHLNVGFPIALLVLLHFVFSWSAVDTDEWGALYFYGRALHLLKPGPYFSPFGLMQTVKAPRGLQQRQAPGQPEQVFHGDDKAPLPPGMVRPIRITTRAPTKEEAGHLDVQMTFSWSFYYQFQIKHFFQFVSNVGSFDHAAELIRDTGEAVLNEFASTMTVNGMIVSLVEINQKLDDRIRVLVNAWGMEIYEVKALAPNLSHDLATALRDLPISRIKAEQDETEGKGKRRRTEEEGSGLAFARQAMLEAEAEGLKAKKEGLGVSGEDVLAAEVARDAFKHANTIIAGASGGLTDILGAVKAGQAALTAKNEDKKE
ncbi:MAG: SPFH domain-containing protein [Nitrospirota bacterium]|nr:SPFH domain-containing protein [Nitrospirota bacterium]